MLSVILQSVIMLSVIMLSVIMLSVIMLSVIMLSIIMLSVIKLSVIMLSDTEGYIILIAIMQNVIIASPLNYLFFNIPQSVKQGAMRSE